MTHPKLVQLSPLIRAKVAAVLADLERHGLTPVIGSALRTKAVQKLKVKAGVSKTMRSFHLADADGLARAADIIDKEQGWQTNKLFWMKLGSSALAHGLGWGGLFGLSRKQKRALIKALLKPAKTPEDWHHILQFKLGWDPAHLEYRSNFRLWLAKIVP